MNKKDLIDLKKTMITYRDLYNVIKSFNYTKNSVDTTSIILFFTE